MKNFYMAVAVCQDKNESILEQCKKAPEPGYCAFVVPISENDNLKARLDGIGGLIHANVCVTKKQAAEIVDCWNASYKANGTYFFDSPLF